MHIIKSQKLLIVDDQVVNRSILSELFRDEYKILEAENGVEALKLIDQYGASIVVVLLDLLMPIMDGYTFLENMNNLNYLHQIPIIVVTADNSHEALIKAYDCNVADVIMKPYNAQIVKRRVANIVELYEHKNHLEKLVDVQATILKKQEAQLRKTNDDIITLLTTTIEFRNGESGLHCRRIKNITAILLNELMERYPKYNIFPYMIEPIANASQMHDIGKVAIPDSILLKPDLLTNEEFEIIKKHTTSGCEMLQTMNFTSDSQFYQYCYDICRSHHERYDGEGYPDQLVGENIPIWAQVVSLADVYDALVSLRIYKEAYSHDVAVDMIFDHDCGVFNPDILDCFTKCIDKIANLYHHDYK